MKKLLIPLALVLSLYRAPAAPLYFDPFADATANGGTSYTVGSALAGQKNNAANSWGAINPATNPSPVLPLIAAGNLSAPNLPASSGNSAAFFAANSNSSVRLNFNASVTNGAAYYSYILKITNISQVPTTAANNFFAGFSDGSTAQNAALARIGTRVLTKATNGGFVLGVGRNNTTGDYVYDGTVHTVGETIFIVGSYEFTGTVTNVNLWINPPTNSFGSNAVPTPTVSAVHFANSGGDLNTNRVQGFVILCQNSNAPSGLLDELRIGTTWSDVTGGDPAILVQPANVAVPMGNNATFTVTARGNPTLTYGWMKNGSLLTDGGNISGSASPTLTVSGVSSGDIASYSVNVTNGLGSFVTSTSATLSFQTDPVITGQPQSVTTNFGSTVMFQVTPGGTAPFNYVWHKVGVGDLSDGGNISGSHSNILTLTGVAFMDGGSYSVTVSNINGTVDSSNATLTVLDPFFSTQPVSLTNAAGTTANFTSVASGTGVSTYQWYKNGAFIFTQPNASGQFSPNLTLTGVSSTDQASYYVTATGSFGTATSSVVTLTVLSPVSIATPPVPRTVAPGSRVVLLVGAAGSGPLTYQWQLGGTAISNANSSVYTISNVQPAVAGNYSVIVSNSFSSITSAVAAVTISNTISLAQTNLIVIRVGDGAQTLGLTGNSVYLDQYQTDGTYVNTMTIPDSGTNALVVVGMDNQNGVNSGPTTGSCITRSLDGRFMTIAGYNTNLTYTSNLGTSISATIPRAIGLVDSTGAYTMPVADISTNFDNTYWRAGVTDGSNNFFGAGAAPGTYYFGFSAAPAMIQISMPNMRSMSLYNGDIYCAGAQGSTTGVLKVSGTPKTAAPSTFLFPGSTGTFDMTVSPNGNLIYVADQRALGTGGTNGGIQRWDFNGTTWTLSYTLQIGGNNATKTGPRYLVGDFSGANPVLYATSNDGTLDNNRIVVVTDTGAGSTPTSLASAGINQTFRGIQFGPVPNTVVARPTLVFTNVAGNLVLSWTGSFHVQSSTNVGGGYTNVTGGTNSPFTNTIGTENARFFRLSN